MARYSLDLYTPQGTVIKNFPCDDVLIPTESGMINILPDHTHLLANLATGILTAKGPEGTKKFSITAGICKVLQNKISILSTTSETADKIDVERAKKAKEEAEKHLAGQMSALSDLDVIKYQRKLERAMMRIELGYLGKS